MSGPLRCRGCKRAMWKRSPDGLGPKCRRKQRDKFRTTRAASLAAAARRRFGSPKPLSPGQLPFPKEHFPVSEQRLVCLSEESAAAVVAEAARPGDVDHTARQDGCTVLITYYDARYPLDVADWAGEHGLASDEDAARVIAGIC